MIFNIAFQLNRTPLGHASSVYRREVRLRTEPCYLQHAILYTMQRIAERHLVTISVRLSESKWWLHGDEMALHGSRVSQQVSCLCFTERHFITILMRIVTK